MKTMGRTPLPAIKVEPDGRVTAGPFELRPTSKLWRKRRCGVRLTGWLGTPRLCLISVLRRERGL